MHFNAKEISRNPKLLFESKLQINLVNKVMNKFRGGHLLNRYIKCSIVVIIHKYGMITPLEEKAN